MQQRCAGAREAKDVQRSLDGRLGHLRVRGKRLLGQQAIHEQTKDRALQHDHALRVEPRLIPQRPEQQLVRLAECVIAEVGQAGLCGGFLQQCVGVQRDVG